MTMTGTLTLYVARRFLGATFAMLAGLTLLVALFDFIELLRRAATRPDAGFALVATTRKAASAAGRCSANGRSSGSRNRSRRLYSAYTGENGRPAKSR